MPQSQFPFRADHVGSLLRPQQLTAAREAHAQGRLPPRELHQVEDSAIADAVRRQEEVGLPVVTDGEFRRAYWHLDFLTSLSSVRRTAPKLVAQFHDHDGPIPMEAHGLEVVGKIGRPAPIFVDHFRYLKTLAKGTPKITIPSPSILHFRGGRAAIDAGAYPDLEPFFADLAKAFAAEIRDLAAAGCEYLQIDDTNFAYLCDAGIREQVRARHGVEPEQLARRYADLINASIRGRPATMKVMLHVCRGNFRSAWAAEGGYEPVAEILFNALEVDGYFLEFDDERSGDFSPLRHLPRGRIATLGLITSKNAELEEPQAIKRRIDEAARFAPLEQLALSPQCGFASTCEGNKVSAEDQWRKLRLVSDIATDVWR
ncbi:MAG TPA: 5-methyltetrahydropteroyltriglutamate--homocysteine S-methyltransferase [Steroidobacteraceae bacterium]|nr:5-methyltetrahydropteroyltriglutamate--homocysteine S-methyltransferase [Steroidobacteraceae bacterium]